MSLIRFLLLTIIVVLAATLPADEIIPESSDIELLASPKELEVQPSQEATTTDSNTATKIPDFDHRAKALETIALVKAQGGDTAECEAVATELKKSVNDAVSTSNKELAALSTGSDCPARGQTAVAACAAELVEAREAASAAKGAIVAALQAPQKLTLEALMQCMSTSECPQIKEAEATLASAKKNQLKKDEDSKIKDEECLDFKKSAAQQMTECQCAAKKAHDKAWKAATSGADEREESWETAEHLLCALKNKQVSDCERTATPTVEAVKLAVGVADAVCPTEEGGGSHCPSTLMAGPLPSPNQCGNKYTAMDSHGDLYTKLASQNGAIKLTREGTHSDFKMTGMCPDLKADGICCLEADRSWPKMRECTSNANQRWSAKAVSSNGAVVRQQLFSSNGKCLRTISPTNCRTYVETPTSDVPCIGFDFEEPSCLLK